jgi:hypothetical protein
MPFWETIDTELNKRLNSGIIRYYGDIIEFNESKQLQNGQVFTGSKLFDIFSAEGTPFFLSNGVFRGNQFVSFQKGYDIVWDVFLHLFRFLKKVFDIPREI